MLESQSYSILFALSIIAISSLFRFLNLFVWPSCPILCHRNSSFNKAVLAHCSILRERYLPTLLWGKCGHVQTIIFGLIGRFGNKSPPQRLKRESVATEDGSLSTFDIYEPQERQRTSTEKPEVTLIVCPGIGNNSQSVYIQTFVTYCLQHHYRVIVLNHVGTDASVPLTSPRIFTYGHTCDLDGAVQYAVRKFHNNSLMVGVGFSMGANLLMKYLGEKPSRQSYFLCAISICQGYDIEKSRPFLNSLNSGRVIYNYMITRRQKQIINNHWKEIYPSATSNSIKWDYYCEAPYIKNGRSDSEIKKTDIPAVEEKRVYSSRILEELDENFSRLVNGFAALSDYYGWASSKFYLHKLELPVLLVNSSDDPLIPSELFGPAISLSSTKDKALFVVTQNGGHLGFFEGGVVIPETVTWIDRVIVEYIKSIIFVSSEGLY